jgi:NADH-quinone oxidoreductase subunit N
MNLALFSCLLMLKRNDQYYEDIDDLSGLSKNHPLLSLSLLVILFSLAGIPPLLGFFSKYLVFVGLLDLGLYFLGGVVVLVSCFSTFYYLRIIKLAFIEDCLS